MDWNPVTHPFVVRTYRQSSQAGCFGWAVDTMKPAFATYAEARAMADKPLGAGQLERYVCQALNTATWQRNGKWHTCFSRKRGNKIRESGPVETSR